MGEGGVDHEGLHVAAKRTRSWSGLKGLRFSPCEFESISRVCASSNELKQPRAGEYRQRPAHLL